MGTMSLGASSAGLALGVTLGEWEQQAHKGVLAVESAKSPCKVSEQTFVLLWPHGSFQEVLEKMD